MAFPTAPILDTFTDASAPRNLDTYNPLWTVNFVSLDSSVSPQTVVGGTVRNESGGVNTNAKRTDISVADVEVYATVIVKPTNGSFFELGARIQNSFGTLNCYWLAAFSNVGSDTLELWKVVSGTFSQVTVVQTAEFAVNDQIGMSLIGTTITFYKNGSQVGSPVTDSSVTGAGTIGLRFADNNTCQLDDFGGGAPVTEPPVRRSVGLLRPVVYT